MKKKSITVKKNQNYNTKKTVSVICALCCLTQGIKLSKQGLGLGWGCHQAAFLLRRFSLGPMLTTPEILCVYVLLV